MNTRDKVILNKIVEEISYLEMLLKNISEEDFLANETIIRAATMTSINVGELAKRLSNEFFQSYPESELRIATKTRDVYAHGYFTLSYAAVYKTAKEDYPRLKKWIEKVLVISAETEEAIQEAKDIMVGKVNAKSYNSVDEMLADL